MAYTVADALLDELADLGVRTCFGVPGVHNLPLWAAAGTGRRPRILGVRHEQAAGHAADALARTTGGLGVAVTTTGPGFTNALTAFGEAYAARSPLLLLSSETPLGPRRARGADDGLLHGMRSQSGAVAHGFGARVHSATTAHDAVAALRDLTAHARESGRPVYLGVPADVLASPYAGAPAASPPRIRPPVDAAAVDLAARALDGRRVVLWLGARAVAHEPVVAELATATGAAVVTTFQARGMLAGHPGLVDAPPHEAPVARLIGDADVLLVVGDDLHGMTTRNWTMPVPPAIVAVTDDPDASLGDYDLVARLVGDVGDVVRALLDALPTTAAPAPPDADAVRREVQDALAQDSRTDAARAFVESVDEGWPDAGAVVADMCVAGYWLGGYSRQPRPRRLVYPVGWGTLGFALPAAIGPAAAGIPTLAVVGDGGAAMALGELATYTQERLPIALLVVADGGYGMLRYDQDAAGRPHRGVDLLEPRWDHIAAAFGLALVRTDDPGTGLSRALTTARDGMTCGERTLVVLDSALLPPRTTSPRWNDAPA